MKSSQFIYRAHFKTKADDQQLLDVAQTEKWNTR